MIISKWDSGFTDQQKIEMKQFILYYFKELLKVCLIPLQTQVLNNP